MKYAKLAGLLLLSCIITALYSCKKSSNSNPLGGSTIARINLTNSDGEVTYYRIVYDAAHNVDSIVYTGGGIDTGNNGFLKFSYLNSSYTITDRGNNYTYVDINTSLMIDTVTSSTSSDVIYMQYNNGTQIGAVNTKVLTSTYPYYTINIVDYSYNNGDITNETFASGAYAYTYDAGHSGQLGDPQRISQFLQYGRAYTTSTHLATALNYGSDWLETYSYTFDGSGRISQMTRVVNNTSSGGGTDTLRYNYFYNY